MGQMDFDRPGWVKFFLAICPLYWDYLLLKWLFAFKNRQFFTEVWLFIGRAIIAIPVLVILNVILAQIVMKCMN